jgi:uncharacterized protein YbaP (TraB family)
MTASQDLYLEIADLANTAGVVASLAKIGFDRDHPLSTKISKADVALLDAAAKRYGLGGEATFEPMQPWLAFMMLSTLPALHSGYAVANGVDLQIRKEFVAAGKPINGFETFDMQAHIFADMPEAVQIALLEVQLKNVGAQTSVANLDAIVNAWLSGNQGDLANALHVGELSKSPIYAKLFSDRNKAWASALAQRLNGTGTSFVSVGAGHLVGPDGVPALLQRMGYTVTRVQTTDIPTMAPASPTPAPTSVGTLAPTPSPAPIPITLTPPAKWTARTVSLSSGTFKADRMWVAPTHLGVIVTGHIDLPGVSSMDLDTLDTLFHQGLVAGAGAKGVQASTHVRICNGKQDGTYSKVTLGAVRQDIVLTFSGRGYLAQYIRPMSVADDPAAIRALLSLCAP